MIVLIGPKSVLEQDVIIRYKKKSYIKKNAPVASHTVVGTFVYVALTENMVVSQIDVKNSFWNGILEK